MERKKAGEKIKIVVKFHSDADSTAVKPSLSKAQRLARLKEQKPHLHIKGLESAKIKHLWAVNSIALEADIELIEKLSLDKTVDSIHYDRQISLPEKITPMSSGTPWNMEMINAHLLWQKGFAGQGITVAVMDSGVDIYHPDLSVSWRGGTNSWYDTYGQYSMPTDTDGHGTGVAGIIAGGSGSGECIGAAPGAKWIAVKIFDGQGNANYSNIHLAFQWLLDPDGDPQTDDAPDIVNNSWGIRDHINQCVDEFEDDIEQLNSYGISVVFSAGNEGPYPSTSLSPANYPACISVGAVDGGGLVSVFSSRGPGACGGGIFPVIAAPGVNIKTADLTFNGVIPDSYTYGYGTSFSAPHVAGVLALLMSAFPQCDGVTVRAAVTASANDLGTPGADNSYGNGLIDAEAAYRYLSRIYRSGDFNFDASIDHTDLLIMAGLWLDECGQCECDINADGAVDYEDFSEFALQF